MIFPNITNPGSNYYLCGHPYHVFLKIVIKEEICFSYYRFYTLQQRPELSEQLFVLGERSFPKFLQNNDTAQYSSSFEDIMFKYCIVMCDDEDHVLGGGFI